MKPAVRLLYYYVCIVYATMQANFRSALNCIVRGGGSFTIAIRSSILVLTYAIARSSYKFPTGIDGRLIGPSLDVGSWIGLQWLNRDSVAILITAVILFVKIFKVTHIERIRLRNYF